MKRKTYIILLSLFSVAISSSCQKTNIAPTEDLMLRFNLNMPTGLTKSSADVINDIYVFFFNTKDNKIHSVVRSNKIETEGPIRRFEIILTGADQGEYYAHVISNIDSFMTGKDYSSIYNGFSYSDLQAELKDAFVSSTNNLVMWGKSEAFLSSTSDNTLTFSLLRSVARVEISVQARIPFILKSTYIYNSNDAIAFMPEEASYTENNTGIIVSRPSLAGTASTAPYQGVYIPEADVIKEGVSGDHNHLNRCAIVVGGIYNGDTEENFYRVDFKKHANSDQLLNILRNHLYRLNITSVTGPGYLTPEQAYASQAINMIVDIQPWEEVSQDIIFDAQSYIQLGSRNVLLPGAAGTETHIKVITNIDPAAWEMDFASNSTIYLAANKTGVQSNHFIFSRPITVDNVDGEYEYFFTITAKNNLGEGSADKIETVNIKASRLTFSVTITQKPISSEDWDDGGNGNIIM